MIISGYTPLSSATAGQSVSAATQPSALLQSSDLDSVQQDNQLDKVARSGLSLDDPVLAGPISAPLNGETAIRAQESDTENGDEDKEKSATDAEVKEADKKPEEEKGADGLTSSERQYVAELQLIDKEVKSHEQAHKNAGGRYTGNAQYQYEVGPDNKQYAVSGEVSISTSPIPGKPEETIRKLRVVRRAALAPAEPSAQDQQVAGRASQGISVARTEIRLEKRAEFEAEKQARDLAEAERLKRLGREEAQTENLTTTEQAGSNANADQNPSQRDITIPQQASKAYQQASLNVTSAQDARAQDRARQISEDITHITAQSNQSINIAA